MTDLEQRILAELRELERAVRLPPGADSTSRVGPVLARLDELTRQLPADSDPRLRHYLERQSYEKAKAHLEEGTAG